MMLGSLKVNSVKRKGIEVILFALEGENDRKQGTLNGKKQDS